jgi:hypothetical protein
MYLKQLHIANNGPLREAKLDFPFTAEGNPKPIIIVGGNGRGKTNLLYIITDSLFQAAETRYQDVFPGMSPLAIPVSASRFRDRFRWNARWIRDSAVRA